MLVTQKCQYALRALLELAKHDGRGPLKIAQIAENQTLPFRFLEVILSQLKQGGFVESRRGTEGGYLLARKAGEFSVADVVVFVDGPMRAAEEETPRPEPDVLAEVWSHAAETLLGELASVSIADLLEREERLRTDFVPNYQI